MVKHPSDWCAKRCGIPLDPVLIVMGRSMHPSCEFPELAVSKTPESNVCSGRLVAEIHTGSEAATNSNRALGRSSEEQPLSHNMPRRSDGLGQAR